MVSLVLRDVDRNKSIQHRNSIVSPLIVHYICRIWNILDATRPCDQLEMQSPSCHCILSNFHNSNRIFRFLNPVNGFLGTYPWTFGWCEWRWEVRTCYPTAKWVLFPLLCKKLKFVLFLNWQTGTVSCLKYTFKHLSWPEWCTAYQKRIKIWHIIDITSNFVKIWDQKRAPGAKKKCK